MLRSRLALGAKLLFTLQGGDEGAAQAGLKQFQHPAFLLRDISGLAYGFNSEPLSYVFPAHQNTMRLTRLADDDDDEDEES